MTAQPLTKADIEAKLRRLQGDVEQQIDARKGTAIKVAVGIGLVVVVIAFLLGTRKGARKTTIVEIRRV